MNEVIIFRVPEPESEEDVLKILNFRLKLEEMYVDTNQVPLVITSDIEVVTDIKKNK